MNVDIRTILIAFHVVICIFFCIITLAWYNAKSMRNILGCWSISQALYGIGTMLLVLRNIIPDLLSVVVANACLIGAHIATQEGLARYMARDGFMRKTCLATFALTLIFLSFYTFILPSVALRIMVYSIALCFVNAISIKTVWRKNEPMDSPRFFLVAGLVIGIVILFFRAVYAVYEGTYPDLMHSGFVQSVGIIGLLLAYVSISISLFWLLVHRLVLEVQRQAALDFLTNIGNRRALDELMEKNLPMSAYRNIGIMMTDIDRFKEINDKFGHQAGDIYLTEFVRVIKQLTNLIYRYGGDEFVVVAYNTDMTTLLNNAEYLRQQVERLTLPWTEQGCINTTVSIGLAMADHSTRNWDDLLRKADKALYKVKSEGGNKVMAEL